MMGPNFASSLSIADGWLTKFIDPCRWTLTLKWISTTLEVEVPKKLDPLKFGRNLTWWSKVADGRTPGRRHGRTLIRSLSLPSSLLGSKIITTSCPLWKTGELQLVESYGDKKRKDSFQYYSQHTWWLYVHRFQNTRMLPYLAFNVKKGIIKK